MDFFRDWTTTLMVVFIVVMSVFNVFFIITLNQLGRYQTDDLFRVSPDYETYSVAAAAYGATPVDIGLSSEPEDVMFIIIDNAALLNTGNPLSNIVPTREGIIIYKVQKGDNISRIAANFGVSINTILWANENLKPNVLRPGQELVILPVIGVLHHIQEGETLDDIASKYNISAQRILAANPNWIPAKISMESTIIIPDSSPIRSARYASASLLPDLSGYFAIPTTGWNWGKLHNYNAVDIANACGIPVYASAEGLVVEEAPYGWNYGYGRYLVIEHPNGTKTKYAHNHRNLVSVGDYVLKGDQIATIGNTGLTHGPTGCHLHFEVRNARNPFAK